MCNMLMSINPEYVRKILDGTKKYEFRKVNTKKKPNKIIIYATYPIGKIVGEMMIENTIIDNPKEVWEITKDFSGVDKDFFNEYYKNKTKAIAYKIGEVIEYEEQRTLKDVGLDFAPQSFVYL